eukprot:3292293-Prymnesium_polylepis.2
MTHFVSLPLLHQPQCCSWAERASTRSARAAPDREEAQLVPPPLRGVRVAPTPCTQPAETLPVQKKEHTGKGLRGPFSACPTHFASTTRSIAAPAAPPKQLRCGLRTARQARRPNALRWGWRRVQLRGPRSPPFQLQDWSSQRVSMAHALESSPDVIEYGREFAPDRIVCEGATRARCAPSNHGAADGWETGGRRAACSNKAAGESGTESLPGC